MDWLGNRETGDFVNSAVSHRQDRCQLCLLQFLWNRKKNPLNLNSAIHKVASLMVPGRSMILPEIIPENLLGHEWDRWLEVSEVVPTASRTVDSGFVNSTIPTLKLSMGEQPLGVVPAGDFLRTADN